jgi:hypothetical protein
MRHQIEAPYNHVVESTLASSTGDMGKELLVRTALRHFGPVTWYIVTQGRGDSKKVMLRTRDLDKAVAKYNDLFEDF